MNATRIITAVLGSALALTLSGQAIAQERQRQAAACGVNQIAKGSIGYSGLECHCDFTYLKEDTGGEGQFFYHFRAEPVIRGAKPGGPADGKLRDGDVVTAIDGYLITTREGGKRFADPEVGRPLTLTVRRGGREVDVEIVPEWECMTINFADPAPPAMPAPPEPVARAAPPARVAEPVPDVRVAVEAPVVVATRLRVAVPLPPRPLMALPKGYFGFGISCRECSVKREDDVPVWEFTYNPELTGVEPGMPAHDAGMRSGDILTHINGHELTSPEGGRLFGAVQPGDTVTFRFARDNTSREAQVVATERVVVRLGLAEPVVAAVTARAVPLAAAEITPKPADMTRFTGVLGDAHIVVSGGPITVSRTDDEVIIVSGDIRVRITRK